MSRGRKREVIIIDCETDPFQFGRIPKPFIWGMYDGQIFRHFSEVFELVELLRKRHCVVYAHNGGRFDFLFLVDFLQPYTMVRLINGRMAGFKIGKALFRDSFLIFPIALRNYKKGEIDYRLMEAGERDKPENKALILDYLEKDCRYLHELVMGYRLKYGSSITLASSAMKFFKELGEGTEIPKTTRNFYDDFKPYYHGGRVSCFLKGIVKGTLKIFDINSAYPFAMLHSHVWGMNYETWLGILPPEGIEQAFIHLRASSMGSFCRIDENGALEFPSDGSIQEYFVTGWEFLAAKETGTLKNFEIIKSITFKQHIDFTAYVNYFYGLKKKSDKKSAEYLYAKLFLNSLYGKFAANPNRYKNFWIVPKGDIYENKKGKFDRQGRIFENFIGSSNQMALVSRGLEKAQQRYYNVATAASITGYVRAMLWRVISNDTIYCDTDSIILSGEKFFPVSGELGAWKEEKAECGHEWTQGAFAAKKLYAIWCGKCSWRGWDKEGNPSPGWKTASKGVRLTGPEIFDLARGKGVKYRREAPSMSLKMGARFIERRIKTS